MTVFGSIFRISLMGESHGPVVGVLIEGCPAGIPLQTADFQHDLSRRQGGNREGTTPRKEADEPQILSGRFNGFTTGTPILILFENQNIRSGDYEKQRAIPRPGHADWVARQKYRGFEDFRGGGHFSARLTTGLVAAGVIAKKLLPNVSIQSKLIEAGGEADIEKGIQKAIEAHDSIGGIAECRISGLPPGLGEPWFDSAESLISHIVFSIPAVRGIEFGTGFPAAKMFGSQHNDPILNASGTTATNHAGGITGGLTNGNEVFFRVAFKPASSIPGPQTSFNWETGQMETFTIEGRHDLCVALRAPVILEAVAALVFADLLLLHQSRLSV